ncbi:MAG TPA: hemolysin family protein [Actinomycetota bacterium]|nr:hemolysin family protein [Actinomycetota bacterium]
MTLLIAAHALFVAGEFGLVAVDRQRAEARAAAGDRRAEGVVAALRSLSFQLSGAQLGITVTSLLVGFAAEPTIGRALRPLLEAAGLPPSSSFAVSVALALVLATSAEMVVAELVPKNIAIAEPERVAFAATGALRAFNTLARPLIVVLNSGANWTVRLFRIEPREELIPVRSLEELDLLVHASRARGALPEEQFSLLARSLSFPDKTAADALVPRTSVAALPHDATVGDMQRVALDTGHSRFPVFRDDLDDVVGIAHVKDGYALPADARDATPVTRIARDALFVPESRDLESLLLQMRRERRQLAVVVDEFGGTAGIVTLEDILEEIVGDIEDEHDPSGGPVPARGAAPVGVHVLPGLLHPDEVREACGLELPEGPYDTLAGFLLWRFDRIPERGARLEHDGWRLEVAEMERHRIATVVATAPERDGGGEP